MAIETENLHLSDYMDIFDHDEARMRINDILYQYALYHLPAGDVDEAMRDAFFKIDDDDPYGTYVIHGTDDDIEVYRFRGSAIGFEPDENDDIEYMTYSSDVIDYMCHVSTSEGLISYGGSVDFNELNEQLLEEYFDDQPIVANPAGKTWSNGTPVGEIGIAIREAIDRQAADNAPGMT